jgi:hypothetical protein
VRFTMHDGMTLEIHIPGATRVETADSPTRTAGFVLRNGQEIANVGVLTDIFPPPPAPPRSTSRVARRPRRV